MTVFAPHYSQTVRNLPYARRSVPGVKESGSLSDNPGKNMSAAALNAIMAFGAYGKALTVYSKCFSLPMEGKNMTDFEKICDFQNLYKAHTKARRGKRTNREVIDFEMNLSDNLTRISDSLKNNTYKMSGYYSFTVHDPKVRTIHALHYRDRVVQHCICDEVLAPTLDKKLIYDNAACRIGKGTHFAIKRLSIFLKGFCSKNGINGYFLKCDVRKFFDNIDHDILKQKLKKVFPEEEVFSLLCQIIDSFEKSPGKGLPLGNQTSQWFAIYYLDSFDRLIKEKLRIKYYTRYMDDCVLIHADKDCLKSCLQVLQGYMREELHLSLNEKTEIFPIKNGVDYLGWHVYITDTGKIIKKVKQDTKHKYKRKLRYFQKAFAKNEIELEEIKQVLASYRSHLSYGNTYELQKKILKEWVLKKGSSRI